KLPQVVGDQKTVYFLAIDLHDVVKRGAAEPVPPLPRSRVEIGAAIGHDAGPSQPQLEAQDIVVAVPAASTHAHFSAIDEHVGAWRSQHEETAVGKRFRLRPARRRG